MLFIMFPNPLCDRFMEPALAAAVTFAYAAGGPYAGQRQRDLSLWTPFLRCGGEWVRR